LTEESRWSFIALPSIPSRRAGGEVVGESSRKQEGEIKRFFRKMKGEMIHRKIFFEHPLFGG